MMRKEKAWGAREFKEAKNGPGKSTKRRRMERERFKAVVERREKVKDRRAKREVKVEPDQDRDEIISEVPKAVDDDKMEGSSKKRRLVSSSTSDGPPAKKQRTIAVTTRTTRYGAHPIYLPDC